MMKVRKLFVDLQVAIFFKYLKLFIILKIVFFSTKKIYKLAVLLNI